jgi:tetratricopeptide (TPR) repeat protein
MCPNRMARSSHCSVRLGLCGSLMAAALVTGQAIPTVEDDRRLLDEFPAVDRLIASNVQNGLRAADAARRLAGDPEAAATVAALMTQRRFDDALASLRRIVERRPEKMTEAFSSLGFQAREMIHDRSRDYAERLRGIVAAARTRAAGFPAEELAKFERAMASVDSDLSASRDWRARIAALVEKFDGTETALLSRVDLITDRVSPQALAALDDFVAAHPGTTAAAKALHTKGFHLANNFSILGERAGHDPTGRFFQVVAIARELRSGRYPPSEWVDKAQELVTQFRTYQPQYASESADRILAALEDELPSLLQRYAQHPSSDTFTFFIGYRIGEVAAIKGDPVAGIDEVLDRLARSTAQPEALRLARAEFYLQPPGPALQKIDRSALRPRAADLLEQVSRSGSGIVHRRALATLATMRFNQSEFELARSLYRQYLTAYPSTAFSWVAAMRAAVSGHALGEPSAAAFRDVAQRFPGNPVARVFGHAYAARAFESAGDFVRAEEQYRAVLTAWDPDYGPRLQFPLRAAAAGASPAIDDAAVVPESVTARVNELQRANAAPGGALLERGRWSIGRGEWAAAAAVLTKFLSAHRQSPLVPDARQLLHHAQLEQALDLVDADQPDGNVAAAQSALEAIAADRPADFAVCAAHIARATLTRLSTTSTTAPSQGDPDGLMAEALRMWRQLDAPAAKPRRTPLEQDAIAIRNVVFRPRGDGVFSATRWNGFQWSSADTPNVVVNPSLRVKDSSGAVSTVVAFDPFPDLTSILFLDPGRRAILERVMVRLGGTKRFAWTQVMQTPNRPAGQSLDVMGFWKKSFWVQPGHWGGWVLEAYPIINEIEFVDAGRTRAAVKVTVGYAGATVQMYKENGIWIARELTNQWVT